MARIKPNAGWVIYVLKHPRTNEVRYVGWTALTNR